MKDKTSILQITPYYPPDYEFGGPVKLVPELCEELSDNFNITVYTYIHKDKNNYQDNSKFAVKRFAPFNRKIAKKLNCYYSSSLIKYLKTNIQNYSLVHTHDFRSFHNIALIKLCQKNKIPVIMSAYKSIDPLTGQSFLKKIFDLFFGKRIISYVDHFIAVSEYEKEDIMKFGVSGNKITIIPNCVKKEDFSSEPNSFRAKYNIDKSKKILLFFSRLHKSKRPDISIKSFISVKNALKDVILIIYGPDNGELKNLQHLAESLKIDKDVIFIPNIAGEEKNSVYNEADLLIQPSPYNEFPLVLVEAMAHGLPIITSDQSIRKYINNKCGKVIPCDADIYSQSIIDLLMNEGEYNKYKQQAQEIFLANFTLDRYLEKLIDVYKIYLKRL
jgi:glycosyltransferase involved in cell wall biosynthesis